MGRHADTDNVGFDSIEHLLSVRVDVSIWEIPSFAEVFCVLWDDLSTGGEFTRMLVALSHLVKICNQFLTVFDSA